MGESTSGAAPCADDRTVVHLMRHGEVHNPTGVLYGRLDGYHLTDLGREMAGSYAAHLETNDIVLVVASPLDRAQQTAAPIAASHGLTVQTDARVVESENYFEGRQGQPQGPAPPEQLAPLRNMMKPSLGEPYEDIVGPDARGRSTTRVTRPADTRPSSSPTSCRSGRCATSSRADASGTTLASVSARSRR